MDKVDDDEEEKFMNYLYVVKLVYNFSLKRFPYRILISLTYSLTYYYYY